MIRKILLSLLIVVGVGGSAVVGTQALLSDNASLTLNTFSTGTVGLEVATNPVTTFAESLPGFSNTNMLPGQTSSHFFKLRNNEADVDLSIAAQAINVNQGGIDPSKVVIKFSPWTTGTTGGSLVVGGAVTSHTLQEWKNGASLGNPALSKSSTGRYYRMDVTIDSSVTGNLSSIFDFVFTGTQVLPE